MLDIIYKIQSAIVATKLLQHMRWNDVWPFEQLGSLSGTQGCKELVLVDASIAEEGPYSQKEFVPNLD